MQDRKATKYMVTLCTTSPYWREFIQVLTIVESFYKLAENVYTLITVLIRLDLIN